MKKLIFTSICATICFLSSTTWTRNEVAQFDADLTTIVKHAELEELSKTLAEEALGKVKEEAEMIAYILQAQTTLEQWRLADLTHDELPVFEKFFMETIRPLYQYSTQLPHTHNLRNTIYQAIWALVVTQGEKIRALRKEDPSLNAAELPSYKLVSFILDNTKDFQASNLPSNLPTQWKQHFELKHQEKPVTTPVAPIKVAPKAPQKLHSLGEFAGLLGEALFPEPKKPAQVPSAQPPAASKGKSWWQFWK